MKHKETDPRRIYKTITIKLSLAMINEIDSIINKELCEHPSLPINRTSIITCAICDYFIKQEKQEKYRTMSIEEQNIQHLASNLRENRNEEMLFRILKHRRRGRGLL